MKRVQWLIVLAILSLHLIAARRAEACWDSIDPQSVANTCPIIVIGEIVQIDFPEEPFRKSGPHWPNRLAGRIYHVADNTGHKSELSDVKVKVGENVLRNSTANGYRSWCWWLDCERPFDGRRAFYFF